MNHRQMKSNPRSLQWLLAVMFCIAPLTAAQRRPTLVQPLPSIVPGLNPGGHGIVTDW